MKNKTLSKIINFLTRQKQGKISFAIILNILIKLILLVAGIISFINGEWFLSFLAILAFVLTFIPLIFEKNQKIDLPQWFELAVSLFIFATMFLGEFHDFYYKFFWWDTMLHATSSLALGFIGFLFVYLLNRHSVKYVDLSPFFIALFAFCFALSIGALWEIFEYAMDSLFGMNMQKWRGDPYGGLVDTMNNIIIDALGAFVSSVIGYLSLKKISKEDMETLRSSIDIEYAQKQQLGSAENTSENPNKTKSKPK